MNANRARIGNELPEIYIQSFIEHMERRGGFLVDYTREPQNKKWILTLQYGVRLQERCYVEILVLDNWVSFTSIVMNNLEGENLVYYYEFLSRISSQLNGFKLGVSKDGNYITLQAEVPHAGFNFPVLLQTTETFRSFYDEWLEVLLKAANKWSLKFRKENVGVIDQMMNLFGLNLEPEESGNGDIIPFPRGTDIEKRKRDSKRSSSSTSFPIDTTQELSEEKGE